MRKVKITQGLDFHTLHIMYSWNWIKWKKDFIAPEFIQKVTNIKLFISFVKKISVIKFDKFYRNLWWKFRNLKNISVKFFGEQSNENIDLILMILSKDYVSEIEFEGNFSTKIVYETEEFTANFYSGLILKYEEGFIPLSWKFSPMKIVKKEGKYDHSAVEAIFCRGSGDYTINLDIQNITKIAISNLIYFPQSKKPFRFRFLQQFLSR